MKEILAFIRTTIVGGVLFLLPVVVIVFVLGKAADLVGGIAEPLVVRLGIDSVAGIAASTLMSILLIALCAFVAGLFALTRAGQAAMAWLQNGVMATLPQYRMIRDAAEALSKGGGGSPVVLVPTDAGWALGVLVEPAQGEWHAVFLPGAPQVFSGSVAYAHVDQIRHTSLTLTQLWAILRKRGGGSSAVYALLADLRSTGKL